MANYCLSHWLAPYVCTVWVLLTKWRPNGVKDATSASPHLSHWQTVQTNTCNWAPQSCVCYKPCDPIFKTWDQLGKDKESPQFWKWDTEIKFIDEVITFIYTAWSSSGERKQVSTQTFQSHCHSATPPLCSSKSLCAFVPCKTNITQHSECVNPFSAAGTQNSKGGNGVG